MIATTTSNPVKVAIIGMTGSGKTVLVTTLAMKMAQMSLEDFNLSPSGDNRRQTIQYTQSNWQTLNEGRWPASTPAGELIELQWELNTKKNKATIQFIDCAGQDIHSLFRTDNFNPAFLGRYLRKVYDNINSANILIFLVNMKDLLASPDMTSEILDLDQMFQTLQQRNDIPRRMAVVFSQFDKYKPEVDQHFNGVFLEYVRHYLPYLYAQYRRSRSFELIPVAAVNDTQSVIENGEVKQYPVPLFSSYNLETLIRWISNSVDQLGTLIRSRSNQPSTPSAFDNPATPKIVFGGCIITCVALFAVILAIIYVFAGATSEGDVMAAVIISGIVGSCIILIYLISIVLHWIYVHIIRKAFCLIRNIFRSIYSDVKNIFNSNNRRF